MDKHSQDSAYQVAVLSKDLELCTPDLQVPISQIFKSSPHLRLICFQASSQDDDDDDSSDENEKLGPIKRKASRQAVFDEDESEEEEVQMSAKSTKMKGKNTEKPPMKKSKPAPAEDQSNDIEVGKSPIDGGNSHCEH